MGGADEILAKSQTTLNEAGGFADRPLQRLVYEINLVENLDNLNGVIPWNHTSLWKYHIHIDINHLRLKLEAIQVTAEGAGGVLKSFLNAEDLRHLQHLGDILAVQSTLISKYGQRIDMADADSITIRKYLEEDDHYFEDKLKSYIFTFNKLSSKLSTVDTANSELYDEELSVDSTITKFLPNKKGKGKCALVFVQYLIDQQNEILQQCRELSRPRPKFDEVDVSDLTPADIVSFNELKDIYPLILSNSEYEATRTTDGSINHTIHYNIPAIEKKIKDKFLLRKGIIKKESIPLMLYPQDVGFKTDWSALRERDDQEKLPLKTTQELDGAIDKSNTAELCENTRTMALVISFLNKLGGEPDQNIGDYVEREIMLPSESITLVPHSCQIRHACAVYEKLSTHRSVRFVENGDDPFAHEDTDFEEIEEQAVIENTSNEILSKNPDAILEQINTLVLLKSDINPDWSLSMVLDTFYDEVEEGEDWWKNLPDEILFKHSSHIFRICVESRL